MRRRRFRVPHTLVLLLGMVVAALLLTYLLPAGSFERVDAGHGRMQVVPGTYRPTPEVNPLSPLAVFTAVFGGLGAAHEIVFFVLITGGALAVLRRTGALDAALGWALARLGHRPLWLVAGGVVLFATGSATIGMAEEYLPFVPIVVALATALGYDAVTAVGILCVGYGIGYGIAPLNPFTVLVAQDIAGLTPGSGWWYRLVLAGVLAPVGVHHVWGYARRVREQPSASYVADLAPPAVPFAAPAMTRRHAGVLLASAAALALLVWGIAAREWHLAEMSALFLGLALAAALVGRLGADTTAETFIAGAAELTGTALLIGFARGIQLVLERGGVIDTIVHGIAGPLGTLPPAAAAVAMFVVQGLTNLFIPSGSGQAFVTMPLMAPLADLVGLSRQVAVLAYQFGDGFTNILVPTNAVLVGILAIAGVPFDRWLRFVVPFALKLAGVGSAALAVAVWVGYR
jgi:uncharacterized ion transporter superfamily protein YfcC